MAAQEYDPNFAVKLMAKDLTYAIEEARRLGVTLETARAGREIFRAAAESGWGERDLSAVIEPLRLLRTMRNATLDPGHS